VTVAAGATLDLSFVLGAAGTFHYWAETSGGALDVRDGDDSQLGGAIVVDPVGAEVRDRVFVLGLMVERTNSSASDLTVINGRSWPHTERLEDGASPAPRVSRGAVPGPVIVLTRGVPAAVDVINRLNEPTAIHWHGIELESRYDGVPDLSGSIGSVTPPVALGETFIALFTPPRAGTFMYHTHWHNVGQLAGGVYGPLIVLEPGQAYDPVHDHIIVLGLDGPYRVFPDEPFVVNGETKPDPLELAAGAAHRLRFIGITADNPNPTVQLLDGFDPIQWTLVAKDGADISAAQRRGHLARQGVAVGETYDFELAPMPPTSEGLWLEPQRGTGELLFQWPVRIK
jgi:FtsP/CotA-like multicopper oxidase with cupredoxin domain